jgi:predicted GIY-YIG superfamily endonuclease
LKYIVYKATSPSGRVYIGVTNDFLRRMKEHRTSPYPFGYAVRKYGLENFTFEFEYFDDATTALEREAELVTNVEVKSKLYYNAVVGGRLSNVLKENNPMHDPEVVKRHPNIWTTENNPMNVPESKARMIASQASKLVSIDGIVYKGIREAARQLNSYRQFVVHRLKSDNFPNWFYV